MQTYNQEQLEKFGKDSEKILLALNGNVYDVSDGKEFYGKNGPYYMFAGKDATFGLGSMSLTTTKIDRELTESEKKIVMDWERRFKLKYKIVGRYID